METIALQIDELTATLETLLVERNRQVVQAAKDGESQASIARRYGITRARVCQLVQHFEKVEATVNATDDFPCPTCHGQAGHRINCPHGIAFAVKP